MVVPGESQFLPSWRLVITRRQCDESESGKARPGRAQFLSIILQSDLENLVCYQWPDQQC